MSFFFKLLVSKQPTDNILTKQEGLFKMFFISNLI